MSSKVLAFVDVVAESSYVTIEDFAALTRFLLLELGANKIGDTSCLKLRSKHPLCNLLFSTVILVLDMEDILSYLVR